MGDNQKTQFFLMFCGLLWDVTCMMYSLWSIYLSAYGVVTSNWVVSQHQVHLKWPHKMCFLHCPLHCITEATPPTQSTDICFCFLFVVLVVRFPFYSCLPALRSVGVFFFFPLSFRKHLCHTKHTNPNSFITSLSLLFVLPEYTSVKGETVLG